MKKTSEPASNRQARQLAAISEATGDIRHIDGKNNVVADALSRCEEPKEPADSLTIPTDLEEAPGLFCLPERPSIHAVQIGIDYQKLAVDQSQDPDVQAYRTRESNLQLADVPWADGTFTVLCDISMGKPRPVVPDSWKRRVFDLVHALSHPGARITKRMVSAKFVWYGLAKQVNDWARQCLQCQKSKVHTHTRAPLQKFEAVSRRFQHVHVDLVGPLPESKGCRYLLTIIDRFTRWPEVVPLRDIEAKTVANAYVHNWVARFCVPDQMTSDRGAQFVSELWTAMSELLGTQLNPTTAYHPQANGLIERLHRTMKAALKARLNSPNWIDELPWVLLGLRTTPKEDLNASPADLVYGGPLTVPGDFLPRSVDRPVQEHLRLLREKVESLRPTPTTTHGAENRQICVFEKRSQKTP